MEKQLAIAATLASLLDTQFGIGKFRFGLSALFDLIPGVGDFIDVGLSLYIVFLALSMRVPAVIIVKMLLNIGINFLFGLIPFFGDLIYFVRKVNTKNVALLREYHMTAFAKQ